MSGLKQKPFFFNVAHTFAGTGRCRRRGESMRLSPKQTEKTKNAVAVAADAAVVMGKYNQEVPTRLVYYKN